MVWLDLYDPDTADLQILVEEFGVEVGHREGDLIMGPGNASAIGTLDERSTRSLILVHLPLGRTAAAVRDALTVVFHGLPPALRRS